jgi:hypothetical protein
MEQVEALSAILVTVLVVLVETVFTNFVEVIVGWTLRVTEGVRVYVTVILNADMIPELVGMDCMVTIFVNTVVVGDGCIVTSVVLVKVVREPFVVAGNWAVEIVSLLLLGDSFLFAARLSDVVRVIVV